MEKKGCWNGVNSNEKRRDNAQNINICCQNALLCGIIINRSEFYSTLCGGDSKMDNNNLYGQGNQNAEQGPQQPYQQQVPNQPIPNPGFDNNNQQQSYNQYYQPYQQTQQSYNQSYQANTDLEEPVSFGDWMLSTLLMSIPCVNIIMMFVWAFGSGVKKSKSNYFKAMLVWMLIWVVLWFILMIGIGGMRAAISESYY